MSTSPSAMGDSHGLSPPDASVDDMFPGDPISAAAFGAERPALHCLSLRLAASDGGSRRISAGCHFSYIRQQGALSASTQRS
jgi:hypothetical protein